MAVQLRLNQIRDIREELYNCPETSEINRLILELNDLERSLVARSRDMPLFGINQYQSPPNTLNDFRALTDARNLDPRQIRNLGRNRGLGNDAIRSSLQARGIRQEARLRQAVYMLLPEIRSLLSSRPVSKNSLYDFIYVYVKDRIDGDLVEKASDMIFMDLQRRGSMVKSSDVRKAAAVIIENLRDILKNQSLTREELHKFVTDYVKNHVESDISDDVIQIVYFDLQR